MTAPRIRVLVVDDSAFARKVLREALRAAPEIEVLGFARDGLEALEKISELKPDVVTLDLRMPNLDGLGVLRALPAEGGPRVIVVTTSEADSEAALEALEAGAVDILHKPTALASSQLYEIAGPLVALVRVAAAARPRRLPPHAPAPTPPAVPAAASPRSAGAVRLVAIGASTGGPQAITRIFRALPGDFPAPLAVVIHMPPGYTASFAQRLNAECAIEVVEASEGLVLRPGTAVIAQAGLHLKIVPGKAGELVARLDLAPLATQHRPAVDVLLETAAQAAGAAALGVILTGMGQDGLAGAGALRLAGGKVIAEAESSCIVYGMPRVVAEAGLADVQLPLDQIVPEILRRV